jgi:hypothetical protein
MKSLDFYKNGLKYPESYRLEIFTESSSMIFKIFNQENSNYNAITIRFNNNYEYLDSIFAGISLLEIEEIIIPLMVKHALIGKVAKKKIEGNLTIYLKDYKEFYPYEQHKFKYHPGTSEPNHHENLATINFNIEKAIAFFNYFESRINLYNALKDIEFSNLRNFISPICCHHRYAVLLYLLEKDWASYLKEINLFYEKLYTENNDEYTSRFLKLGLELEDILNQRNH